MKKLLVAWVNETSGWLTLQLKSEEAFVSLEKELGVFMQAEKVRAAKMREQARLIKIFTTGAAVIFGIVVIGALVYLMRKNGLLIPRR